MENRPIVVLDSWGAKHPCEKYRGALDHVTFCGFDNPGINEGQVYHPHGGLVAWDILSQFKDPVTCVFVQIFNKTASGATDDNWWMGKLREISPSRINCSWGAHPHDSTGEDYLDNYYNSKWVEKFVKLLDEVDADAFFAAGNSGNFSEEYPQKKLVGVSDRIHIIGACDVRGFPSSFSSSANKATGRYVDVTYLGEGSASLDAASGQIVVWNGTSSATPHALGDAQAKNLRGKDLKDYWRQFVLLDMNANGKPDGVAPQFESLIRAGGWLPKVGVGVAEGSRQLNMLQSGLGLQTYNGKLGLSVAPMYHDFERIGY